MQGVERMDSGFLDAAGLVGHLIPAGSVFAFLAEHRGVVFPDELFADLFPSGKGRPSLPAPVMAAILTLQTLHDYSDAETAEAARCDLRWKAACGMALDDQGFHASTLVYWRRRLADSDRPHRINDAVQTVIESSGVLRGRGRRAVDSTILADAVATQDTITQLIAAIRRVARVVPGAGELVAAVCSGHDYSRPGKPSIDWDDKDAKDVLVSGLVNDANALLAALAGQDVGEEYADVVALLALVAGQDVEPAEGSDGRDGRWRIARKVAEDRVISTVDPDARHTRKSPESRRDGYRAHLVAEPGTALITDEALTKAAGPDNSDSAQAATFLSNHLDAHTEDATGQDERAPQDEQSPQGQDEQRWRWYADSAYGTGDLRADLEAAGHAAVIKPKPLQTAVDGGFSVDDFTVDEVAGTATCPNGVTRLISSTRVVTFGAVCQSCPLRAQCTKAKTGRKLVLHEHDALLRAARAQWAARPDLRADYSKHRPNVERVVAQVATRGGRRLKLRYRGTIKNNAWLKRRTAALNLRNLTGRGLTHKDGAWAMATT
jgi:Transposase domain (DUF772)/Transposase DDE domain